MCYRTHRNAHDTSRILRVIFEGRVVGEAGLTLRTANAAGGVGQNCVHVLVQSSTRLQLMRVFQLAELYPRGKGSSLVATFKP